MPLAITPTFSPWTHTSDDSHIYQLSLVLATAIVSYFFILFERSEFLIDTSQKKSLRVCTRTRARVHACSTSLGLSVSYYVPHTYVSHISSAPKIRTPYTQNNISYFGGMYRKNKGVPGLELATYRHAHQKQACTLLYTCLLYTSPSPRDATLSRMPSSA